LPESDGFQKPRIKISVETAVFDQALLSKLFEATVKR
jgi:hypothetical protein